MLYTTTAGLDAPKRNAATPAPDTHGEHLLALAVLEDAIKCYRRSARGHTPKAVRDFYDAYEWIYSPDREWLFSFENICGMLGIDPTRLRKQIARPTGDWQRMIGH